MACRFSQGINSLILLLVWTIVSSEHVGAQENKKQPTGKSGRTDLYGDPLPPGAIARLGTIRMRHAANWLAYAADGKSLYSAVVGPWSFPGIPYVVRHWDLRTGREIDRSEFDRHDRIVAVNLPKKLFALLKQKSKVLQVVDDAGAKTFELGVGSDRLYAIALSPGGRYLGTIRNETVVQVWNVATGKKALEFQLGTGVGSRMVSATGLVFSPDERWMALIDPARRKQRCQVHDLATGKKTLDQNMKFALAGGAAFSPDSRLLAWRDDERLVFWDLQAGRPLHRITPTPGATPVQDLAFSPDGKTLASVADLTLWDVVTGKELPELKIDFGGKPRALAFSPNGKELSAILGCALRRWDLATGREIGFSGVQTGAIGPMAFSPDGRGLATIAEDLSLGFWNIPSGKIRWQVPEGVHYEMEHYLAMAADGHALAALTSAGDAVIMRDMASGKKLQTIPTGKDGIQAFGLLGDGKSLLAFPFENEAHRWQIETGKKMNVYRLPEFVSPNDEFNLWIKAISADGRFIAPGTLTRRLQGKDYQGTPTIFAHNILAEHEMPAYRFSVPRGFVVSGSTVFMAGDGRAIGLAIYTYPLKSSSAQGRRRTGELILVESASGLKRGDTDLLKNMKSETFDDHWDETAAVHGRFLAVADQSRIRTGPIRIWDAVTARECAQFTPDDQVTSLAFSSDNRYLASGHRNSTTLIWDLGSIYDKALAAERKKSLSDQELSSLWEALAAGDGCKAFLAIHRLAAFSEKSIRFLGQHLRPVPKVDEKHLADLCAQLDTAKSAEREKAMRELAKIGPAARPVMRRVLKGSPSLEVSRRLQQLLRDFVKRPFTQDELRVLRAQEALEIMATREALRVLETLAQGEPESILTQEARWAAGRVTGRLKAEGGRRKKEG
jgi:WD40 repeat protein